MTKDSARSWIRRFLFGFVGFLSICTVLSLWLDPFWVWHKTPVWYAWRGGYNWNLDVRMRAAKPLQLLTRKPDIILLGSSRVVHGINPPEQLSMYNFGISGLRIAELEGYTQFILRHAQPKQLVIGLDYFMFDDRHTTEAGYNPALAHARYLIEAVPAALFSTDALHGAWLALSGKGAREGQWYYNGYNQRYAIPAKKMPDLLEEQRENLGRVVYSERGFAHLARTLVLLKRHAIPVTLYLSPMHPSQFALLHEDGALSRFEIWRSKIHNIAKTHRITLHDLIEEEMGDATALSEHGSTPNWIDPSHFSPEVGNRILSRVLNEK